MYRHLTSSQEVPITGIVEIPYVPEQSWKPGNTSPRIPFSMTYNGVQISPTLSQIPSVVITNEPTDSYQCITLKNEIYDNLSLSVNWVNLYNIGPEIGEVRFFIQESEIPEKEPIMTSLQREMVQSKSMTKIDSILLTAKASASLLVFWKPGPHFKRCYNQAVVASLGMMCVVPRRANSMLLHVPVLLKPVLSHLTVSPPEVKLTDFNFGQTFTLNLTLTNTSNETMTIVSRPSLIHSLAIEETLRPHEKRVVSIPIHCSAKALQNNNIMQEAISFVCPGSVVNQASCLITAVITNPLFLTLPDLDPQNRGKPGVLQLTPIFFSSSAQITSFSVTALRVKNLRDIDVFIQVGEEGKNHFSLLDDNLQPIEYARIPQENETTVWVKFSTTNRHCQNSDGNCTTPFRFLQGKARIYGFSILTKSETVSLHASQSSFSDTEYKSLTQLASTPSMEAASETPATMDDLTPLFSFLVDYSGIAGMVLFSVSETQFLLIPRDHQSKTVSREIKITNLNPGMKLPYRIQVMECSNPSIHVSLSKTGGVLEEGKYTYFVFTASFSSPGYSYFVIRVSDEEETVHQDVHVHLFVSSENLGITVKGHPQRVMSPVTTVSLGNVAVCYDTSISTNPVGSPHQTLLLTNPVGSPRQTLLLTNNSGVSMCIAPYSSLPLRMVAIRSTTHTPTSPSLDFPESAFALNTSSSIPSSLLSDLRVKPCCKPIELFSDQTVELRLDMLPRETIHDASEEQVKDIENRGEAPFSGEVFFFNSRGDYYFQQMVTVSGTYYLERISVSCQTTDFGYIFVNSSRPRRLDIRIDNLSLDAVEIDLAKLPLGFVPAVYYIFSQKHANQDMKRNTIDKTRTTPSFSIEEGCYAILTVELDMEKLKYRNGRNSWKLKFSTNKNPRVQCVVEVAATVYSDAISCHCENEGPITTLQWKSIPFPSLQDKVLDVRINNESPLPVRIQPIFCQRWLQQALSVTVIPTQFSLQKRESRVIRLVLHSVTLNALNSQQYLEMRNSAVLGSLQLFVDISTKQENGITRTITEIPCWADFQLRELIEVLPPVLNIVATVEHFSKLDELFVSHYNVASNGVASSAQLSNVAATSSVTAPSNTPQLLKESSQLSNTSQLSKDASDSELSLSDLDTVPDDETPHSPVSPISPIAGSILSTPRPSADVLEEITTPRMMQRQALTEHLKESSMHFSSVICCVKKDVYEFVIRNCWRERLTVSLHRTQVRHNKHGILYSGQTQPVYCSYIEVPERIVIEPEGSVTVAARIVPDTVEGFEKVHIASLFHA